MIPTTYSDSDLTAFVLRTLGGVAAILSWDSGSADALAALDDVRVDTLYAYDAAAIAGGSLTSASDCSDLKKLRALARREAWRAAADATAEQAQFSLDQQSFSNQHVHEHCVAMAAQAASQAAPYDDLDRHTIRRARALPYPDPYGNTVWGSRGLQTLEPGAIIALPGPVVVPAGTGDFVG